jgi:hypothetical protein
MNAVRNQHFDLPTPARLQQARAATLAGGTARTRGRSIDLDDRAGTAALVNE